MKRLIRSIITLFGILVASVLLLSILSVYISPAKVWVFAILGFGFPIFFVINVLLVLFWMYKRRWQLMIPLVAIVFTWSHWGNTYQFANKKKPSDVELSNPLSVMSFNVRLLDVYEWTGRKNVHEEIFDFIKEKNPDVICIQEFYSSFKSKRFTEQQTFARLSQYPYRHIEYMDGNRKGRNNGLATFSKYPIVNKSFLKFDESHNFSIQSDINVNKTRVRVFNNHLESIGFNSQHFNFLDSINHKNEDERRQGLKAITSKLRGAFKHRATQSEQIGKHIANSPYPPIVCGDFNDTPISYVYRQMRGDLKDAFVESGRGFGGTYNGRLPSLRIDYIFHDKRFDSYDCQNIPVNLSDHFPVMTWIDLK